MRPYGVNPRFDQDCCPGHSRFSRETYGSRRSARAQTRDTRIAHRRERRRQKYKLKYNRDVG